MISAKVIEDSIGSGGNKRLMTIQLCYPRFIHAEFMTHRVFSRNASSSRAIPVAKMLEMIRTEPAMPIHWGKNQAGMQAAEQFTGYDAEHAEALWLHAASLAANVAEKMMNAGLHKQVANRILEPFQHIHVVVTATEWDNFFNLRAHPDAQPEIHALAIAMREAMEESTPSILMPGEWHLPYITDYERQDGYWKGREDSLRKISAARCARVSYLKHDGGIPDVNGDLALYERLVGGVPLHASPVEHQATPDVWHEDTDGFTGWEQSSLHGNFDGWIQNRKLVEAQF